VSKLEPLLRDGATDLETLLLEAAQDDAPPDSAARARTLAAIRMASGTAVVGVGVGVGARIVGWPSRWLAKLGPATTKWLLVVGVGAAMTYGGAELMSARAPSRGAGTALPSTSPRASSSSTASSAGDAGGASAERPARIVPSAGVIGSRSESRNESSGVETRAAKPSPRAERRPIASASRAPISVATPQASAAGEPPAEKPPEESTRASAAPVAAAPSSAVAPLPLRATSLHEEAALLESVREALAASQPSRAFATLDRYDAQFASGVLAEEAAVLRIEALLAAGDRAAARRAGEAFEQKYPGSSYTPRVRARVGKNL
jgi:hypothetical protein